MTTKKLSTGDPSTLGSYLKLAKAFHFPPAAIKYLEDKIEKQGEGQEVIASEGQTINMLYTLK